MRLFSMSLFIYVCVCVALQYLSLMTFFTQCKIETERMNEAKKGDLKKETIKNENEDSRKT